MMLQLIEALSQFFIVSPLSMIKHNKDIESESKVWKINVSFLNKKFIIIFEVVFPLS